MVITTESSLGLEYVASSIAGLGLHAAIQHMLGEHEKGIQNVELLEPTQKLRKFISIPSNYPAWVFTKEAQEMYQKIAIDERLDFSSFHKLVIPHATYCLNDQTFIQFDLSEHGWLQGVLVSYYPSTKRALVFPLFMQISWDNLKLHKGWVRECLEQLLRAILYVAYTKPETVQLTDIRLRRKAKKGYQETAPVSFMLVERSLKQTVSMYREPKLAKSGRCIPFGKSWTNPENIDSAIYPEAA